MEDSSKKEQSGEIEYRELVVNLSPGKIRSCFLLVLRFKTFNIDRREEATKCKCYSNDQIYLVLMAAEIYLGTVSKNCKCLLLAHLRTYGNVVSILRVLLFYATWVNNSSHFPAIV